MPKKNPTKKSPDAASKSVASTPTMSKSDFVRSQPGTPAAEVIRRGKEMGLKITESLVYNVRAAERNKRKDSNDAPSTMALAPAELGSPLLERQFRTVVVRLGLDRSEQLLEDFKRGLGEEPLDGKRKPDAGTTARSSNPKSSGKTGTSTAPKDKQAPPAS